MKKILLVAATVFAAMSMNAQELITNGSFATDGVLPGQTGTEWGAWSGNGGTVEVIDGVAVATPAAASDNWALQLEQKSFILENDVTYTVKFKASADADRTIGLTIEDPSNNYALLGTTPDEDGEADATNGGFKSKWTVAITTEPTVYTRTVTIKNILDNTVVKFAFLLSTTTEVVKIDDVSMIASGSTPDTTNTSVGNITNSKLNIYPNPASGVINVNSNSSVSIYDLTGKLVLSSAASKVDVSGIAKGLYMVQSGNKTQKLIIK